MIQKTSLEAFHVLQPDLGKIQQMIYNVLKVYPNSSNHDLSQMLSKPINSITPRVKELRDKGLVMCTSYKTDQETQRRVMCWSVI